MTLRASKTRYGGTRRGTASRERTHAAWSSKSPSRRSWAMGADVVTVVGIGADGWDGLSPAARAAVESAEVLMGSSRQLALVPADLPRPRTGDAAEPRVAWPSPLSEALPGL